MEEKKLNEKELKDEELDKVAGGKGNVGSLEDCWNFLKSSGYGKKAKEIAETEGEPAACEYIHRVICENLGVYPPTRLANSGSTNSTEYKEWQEVLVQYNPAKPEEISKKDDKGGLIGGIFFIAFGIIAIGASIVGKF